MLAGTYNGGLIKIDTATNNYTTYNTDASVYGYVFRKFLRNYAGLGRSDGSAVFRRQPILHVRHRHLQGCAACGHAAVEHRQIRGGH